MKEINGKAEATLDAPAAEVLALVAAVDRYPEWHPDVVRQVEVIDRDRAHGGQPDEVRVTLRVPVLGGLGPDREMLMAVEAEAEAEAGRVTLRRRPYDERDREQLEAVWTIEGDRPTQLSLTVEAQLDVPGLVPLGAVGDTLAGGFVEAAARRFSASA